MTKPNLSWTSRDLLPTEKPRTEAEVKTGKRWTPHCGACFRSFVFDSLTPPG